MTCEEIIDFLMRYLDGELPAAEAAQFEKHLHVCPPCADYLKSYQACIRLGRAACAEEACRAVPEELVRAVLAARRAQ
jgi:anti-sigma factor RsiW